MTDGADQELAAAKRSLVESATRPIDPRDIVDGRVIAQRRRRRPVARALVVATFVVAAVLIAELVGRNPSPHTSSVITGPPPAPATTSPNTLHPLAESQIVAWTRLGRLVVLDANGHELRQLAKIRAGQVGVGPSAVVLTPDRTQALVTWEVAEPGCFSRIGVVPVDGSAPLALWGEGTAPSFSPDGQARRLARDEESRLHTSGNRDSRFGVGTRTTHSCRRPRRLLARRAVVAKRRSHRAAWRGEPTAQRFNGRGGRARR